MKMLRPKEGGGKTRENEGGRDENGANQQREGINKYAQTHLIVTDN